MKKHYKILLVCILLLAIIGIWFSSGYWINSNYSVDERGTIGDMFGAINALFTGLAFAGIIVTIILQRNELALQREELKLQRQELIDTRNELRRSADAQEESQRAMSKQFNAMSLSARINGHGAILEYYGSIAVHKMSRGMPDSSEKKMADNNIRKLMEQIKKLELLDESTE